MSHFYWAETISGNWVSRRLDPSWLLVWIVIFKCKNLDPWFFILFSYQNSVLPSHLLNCILNGSVNVSNVVAASDEPSFEGCFTEQSGADVFGVAGGVAGKF